VCSSDLWVLCNEVKEPDAVIVPFLFGDLCFEVSKPFEIQRKASQYRFPRLAWMTNIPLNKGLLDSHLSFINTHTYLFMSLEDKENTLPLIQKALIDNYNCSTEVNIEVEGKNYALVQLKQETDDTIQ
jgi:hypothetical protein